jgi:hypothetical protein
MRVVVAPSRTGVDGSPAVGFPCGNATWPDEPDSPSTSPSLPYFNISARKSRA